MVILESTLVGVFAACLPDHKADKLFLDVLVDRVKTRLHNLRAVQGEPKGEA